MSAKKKWRVYATVYAGHYCGEYDAEDGCAAVEQAVDEASVFVCHHCSHGISDPALEKFVAECDGEETYENEPETPWEDLARAAGWTPPAKKSAKRPAKKRASPAVSR